MKVSNQFKSLKSSDHAAKVIAIELNRNILASIDESKNHNEPKIRRRKKKSKAKQLNRTNKDCEACDQTLRSK